MKHIQPKCIFLFFLFLYVFYVCSSHPSPCSTTLPLTSSSNSCKKSDNNSKLDITNILQIYIFGLGMITSLCISYLHLCNHVRYVCFSTNLNLLKKTKTFIPSSQCLSIIFSILILVLLFELEGNLILIFFIHMNPNFIYLIDLFLKLRKLISLTIFTLLPLYIFHISITPAAYILSIVVFQVWTCSFKNVSY